MVRMLQNKDEIQIQSVPKLLRLKYDDPTQLTLVKK